MKKIAFVVVYFGRFPLWFPAFLKSCEPLQDIDFFFFSDCEHPTWLPDNVKFVNFQKEEFNLLVGQKTGVNFELKSYYKLCDFKPMWGHFFEYYLAEYDFWGHCDVDLIWGDLRKFVNPILADGYDVIKGQPNRVSGHCAIFKNTRSINRAYQKSDALQLLLEKDEYICFDEYHMDKYWTKQKGARISSAQLPFNFYARKKAFNRRDGSILPSVNQFFWVKGELAELRADGSHRNDMAYLHFRNWKDKVQRSEVSQKDDAFFFSFVGAHLKRIKPLKILKCYLSLLQFMLRKKLNITHG